MKSLIINNKEQAIIFTALVNMQLEVSCNNGKYITENYNVSINEIMDLARKIQTL